MAKIEQPTTEQERELSGIMSNTPVTVKLGKKKVKLRRLHNGTLRKISEIILNEKDDLKVTTKTAAAILLNGYWSIKLLYWFKWRWMYYIVQYAESELTEVVTEGKKKVDAESYYLNTILLTGMKDTIMQMTRKEVEQFQAARVGAQQQP